MKETIDTWQNTASGSPVGAIQDPTSGVFSMPPGGKVGVYQALSTRAGGEVISADQY